MSSIEGAVGALYEKFPYPSYPLFLSLRWQEGYLGSSLFAAQIFKAFTGREHAAFQTGQSRGVLLAGCGEALPYVLRKIEPKGFPLQCVDLSRRSLKRARIRLLLNFKPIHFAAQDINQFLKQGGHSFHHIDSFGVLHHLAEPSLTIKLLTQNLHPHGTCRFMVYNQIPRRWLTHLQKAFALLKLDGFKKSDREIAKKLLLELARAAPGLKERLHGMGQVTLRNNARFVDTFFHAWEIRYDIAGWYRLFAAAGLQVMAVFDRYGELDDISNPLWSPPSLSELVARAQDGQYEGNLEFYLCKSKISSQRQPLTTNKFNWQKLRLHLVGPPVRWFQFDETKSIPLLRRYQLWHHHIAHTTHGKSAIDKLLNQLPKETRQRLARLGAVLPGQVQSKMLREELLQPMATNMPTPTQYGLPALTATPVEELCKKILTSKRKFSDQRLQQVLRRLGKACV